MITVTDTNIGQYHTAVRAVLKHHNLTEVGDGVVEADLIDAVLKVVNTTLMPVGNISIRLQRAWVSTPPTIPLPDGKYQMVVIHSK